MTTLDSDSKRFSAIKAALPIGTAEITKRFLFSINYHSFFERKVSGVPTSTKCVLFCFFSILIAWFSIIFSYCYVNFFLSTLPQCKYKFSGSDQPAVICLFVCFLAGGRKCEQLRSGLRK